MSSSAPAHYNQAGPIRFTRKTVTMILVAGAIATSGPAWYMYFSTRSDTALASGAIIPLANIWFVISNWCCANASFLYARNHLPMWWIVLGWFGLAGGGTDHLIEVYTYYSGNHQAFGHHWTNIDLFGMPMVWFPFIAFGVTSLMGIWGMVYVFMRYAKNASLGTKLFFGAWSIAGGVFAMWVEPSFVAHSTVSWYASHIFVTHALLSMIPVYIVWHYASHINVFTVIPRPAQGHGISPQAGQ